MSAKAEITRMCITEYDEKETLALEREEGRIEALKAAAKNLHSQGYPVEKIASAFDASVVDVKIWLNDGE